MAHDSAPVLHLQLFGKFRLVYGAQPVTTIEAPRLQALLAYLVLHRDAPQSRKHIAFLLYPDSTEEQARTNLRNQIYYLRKTLPNADSFLIADTQTLQWNSSAPFTLDVSEFENAAAQASSSTALREAVNLYVGELLPGCYDDWILPERECLLQKFVEALERLILLLENHNDYRSAISFTERLLRQDPLREETYRRLMRLHVLSGDNTGARRVYQTCIAVLKRELDADPSAETRAEFERLFNQATAAEQSASARSVRSDVSPPKSTHASPNNLPIQLTSFFGREQQISDLKRLLSLQNVSSSRTRLLTFTGAGGSGKTRLAIQVAHDLLPSFQDGAWFVDLAPLVDPALIPQAVASALSVHEQPRRALLDTLLDYLQQKELLLILDNCEQFVAACAEFAQTLLEKCPRLQILATSRARLNLAGETVWLVPTLSLPDADDTEWTGASHSEAVRLFVERAASALPTFALTRQNAPAVAQICRRLDGIPLAIELAAARIKLVTPLQIAARLDDALRLLTRGSQTAPPRQQTLRAAMDWSYALLSAPEQMLFRRLSVFAGGFTLESAEEVCGDNGQRTADDGTESSFLLHPDEILDLLSDLVDKSLVVVSDWEEGEQVRYRMLEPIRQYGQARLRASAEEHDARTKHLHFYLALAERAEAGTLGNEIELLLSLLSKSYEDVRSALRWAEQNGDARTVLQFCGALRGFWILRGYWHEGRQWLERALEMNRAHATAPSTDADLRRWYARALWSAGDVLWRQSDYAQGQAFIEAGLTFYTELGEQSQCADLLNRLGGIAYEQGDFERARQLYEKGLESYRELNDQQGIADSLAYVALAICGQGNRAKARELYEASFSLERELGNPRGMAFTVMGLADLAKEEKDYATAIAFYQDCLTLNRALGNTRGYASAYNNLGSVYLAQGNFQAAHDCLAQSLNYYHQVGSKHGLAYAFSTMAHLANAEEKPELAVELLSMSGNLLRQIQGRLDAFTQTENATLLEELRARLPQAQFAHAWERGQNRSEEEAFQFAK